MSLLEMLDAGKPTSRPVQGTFKGVLPEAARRSPVKRPDGSEFKADLVFSPARFDGEDCIQMMMQRKDTANELAAEIERMRMIDPLTRFA